MAWKVIIEKKVLKKLKTIDKSGQERIMDFVDSLKQTRNPRMKGESLKGPFKKFWKYRVGSYRVICQIKDNEVTVLVVRVAHRKEVYKF